MFKRLLVGLALIVSGSMGMATFSSTQAQACGTNNQGFILTLKPWYYGVTEQVGDNCNVVFPDDAAGQRSFFWTIGLNIVEDMIQIAGFIALGLVIYGGFLFMMSAGEPEKAAAARKTIFYALIGMVIAGSAVLIINLVARTALGINT